jgi:hypothetical protein
VGIRTNAPEVFARLSPYLPPGCRPARGALVERLYSLRVGGDGPRPGVRPYHLLYAGASRLARTLDLEAALDALEQDLQLHVATSAPRRLFVHAGVVAWRGRAVVIPGRSFSGKTTLVAALLRAGATYYSDEYAVFDAEGRVHPYPRTLSLRQSDAARPLRCHAAELGGRTGTTPLPVALILDTRYQHGARWRPRALSPGEALLSLLANTVPARERSEAAVAALTHVVTAAHALKGARGEAGEMAEELLRRMGA